MRVAVIGAGAMGSFFGGVLARAGEDVTFIARGKQLAALNDSGLTIQSALIGDSTFAVDATDQPDQVGCVDAVLFCVKTYDLESAAGAIAPLLGPGTFVLTMQNGVESADRLGEILGSGRALCGVSWVTANVASPGVITHARGKRLIFGEPAGGLSVRVERLKNVFERAGVEAEAHPSIRIPLWQKFMIASLAAGLSALTRLPFGSIVNTEETATFALGLLQEAEAVARAMNVDLPEGAAVATFDVLVALAAESPWAYPSLYHDLVAGRRLEVDALNGAIHHLGTKHGIATPLNFAVYAALAPYRNGAPVLPSRPSD
jgi:2-dehydropantoate 2-reductase